MSINVLADRHHAGLWHALQLLARHLDWTLYTPATNDWWEAGLWNFGRKTYGDDRLARQFLNGIAQPDNRPHMAGHYFMTEDEEFPGWNVVGVSLEAARKMEWAYVIASLDDNQTGFHQFAQEQGARYIVQCGNTGQFIDWDLDPFVLNSSEMPLLGDGIAYHQEIDEHFIEAPTGIWKRDGIITSPEFGPHQPGNAQVIRSFVHLMNETHAFPIWQGLQANLREFTFERYGHPANEPLEDPTYITNAKPIERIAELMATSGWGFHDKPVGDGFGHVIFGWAAVGRPLIGHGAHYRGKMGGVFWRDLETCIDLDKHSVEEAARLIRDISWSQRHYEMCQRIRQIFHENVDYAAEALAIREALEG